MFRLFKEKILNFFNGKKNFKKKKKENIRQV